MLLLISMVRHIFGFYSFQYLVNHTKITEHVILNIAQGTNFDLILLWFLVHFMWTGRELWTEMTEKYKCSRFVGCKSFMKIREGNWGRKRKKAKGGPSRVELILERAQRQVSDLKSWLRVREELSRCDSRRQENEAVSRSSLHLPLNGAFRSIFWKGWTTWWSSATLANREIYVVATSQHSENVLQYEH